MMRATILGMLAETPIHPGSGRGLGVVDLPVAREAATDYPVVVGSSLKGALKDKAERMDAIEHDDVARCFGTQDSAGELLVSDARLLLLPVRSLTSSYRWATCPHLIERFGRDLKRAGQPCEFALPQVARGTVHTHGNGQIFLEERQFEVTDPPCTDLVEAIKRLIRHDETRDRVESQFAVLNDDDFAWFARYGLSIQARNQLDDKTKSSKNLWYEETLPPDTLMYAVVAGRTESALNVLDKLVSAESPYLQVGGNETVGQGWFAVTRIGGDGGTGE